MCDNYILGITHSTKCSNIPLILKSGYIKSVLELNETNSKYTPSNIDNNAPKNVNMDEFPGIFMGILTNDDINKKWDGSIGNLLVNKKDNNIVTLVFSTVLLKQNNWHANLVDNMGFITNKTFSKPSLKKFINCIKKEQNKNENKNEVLSTEIVFHDKINVNTIQEIWVRDTKYINILKNKIPKKYHDIIKKVCYIPNINYNKYCSFPDVFLSKIIDLKSKPNFCYWVGNYADKKKYTTKYAKQIASNCGISLNDINTYLKNNKLYDELYKLANINYKVRSNNELFYPNFNWDILFEEDRKYYFF